jgi:hypothetical protein
MTSPAGGEGSKLLRDCLYAIPVGKTHGPTGRHRPSPVDFFSAMSQCSCIVFPPLSPGFGCEWAAAPSVLGANRSHQSVACLDRCRMDLVNAQRIRFDPGALGCD